MTLDKINNILGHILTDMFLYMLIMMTFSIIFSSPVIGAIILGFAILIYEIMCLIKWKTNIKIILRNILVYMWLIVCIFVI